MSKSEIARWIRTAVLAGVSIGLVLLVLIGLWLAERNERPAAAGAVFASAAIKPSFALTQPLPEKVELNADKVTLGGRLFHDPRLSGDDSISCASCHNLSTGGVDNRAHSFGVKGAQGEVNAPTVFNSGFNFVQFWDGRAATLEDQVEGPINNPKEMASSWGQVIGKLLQDDWYPLVFNKLYGDGITQANIKDAIATFERSLVTPNSRFDKYLRGDDAALNAQEKRGYELFQSLGCASCHQGINLGGNMYEKMGLLGNYFSDRGRGRDSMTLPDNGRYNVTARPENMHEFRVPSLRNVALTAPYFHDGNAATLEQAVTIMVRYQLGRKVGADEMSAIVAFLRTLTGEYQGSPL